MKISEAIASLVRELHDRGDVEVRLDTPSDHCEKHPNEYKNCSYCDLCAHGVNRNMDCPACHAHDDPAWMTQPVTETEIEAMIQRFAGVEFGPMARLTPYSLRNYGPRHHHVGLMPILAAELRAHRRAAPPSTKADPT